MKKTIILLLALIQFLFSMAQDSTTHVMQKEDYLLKSHSQKKTAWILMGGGMAVFTAGVIYSTLELSTDMFISMTGETEETSSVGPALVIGGAALMLSSIPVFVASKRNHNKAINFHTTTGTIDLFKRTGLSNPYFPAIAMTIPLGKRR